MQPFFVLEWTRKTNIKIADKDLKNNYIISNKTSINKDKKARKKKDCN